jgi:hypothetical protein
MAAGGASSPGLAANTPLPGPRPRSGAACSLPPPGLGGSCPKEVSRRLADIDGPQLANMTSPPGDPSRRTGSEQPAPPRVLRARRRDRRPGETSGRRGPRLPTAGGRGRSLCWAPGSPCPPGCSHDRRPPQHRERAAHRCPAGGDGLWALLTREPVPPHACSVSLGLWLLVAPSPWYFQSPVASHHSRAVGLLVVALSAWALWTGPRTRPPLDPGAGAGQAGADRRSGGT